MSHTDFGDFKRIRSNKLNLWYISNTRLRKSVSKDLGGFQQNIVNILSFSHPWLSAVSYGASKSKSTVITARAQFPILAQRTLQALMARSHVNTSRAENLEERKALKKKVRRKKSSWIRWKLQVLSKGVSANVANGWFAFWWHHRKSGPLFFFLHGGERSRLSLYIYRWLFKEYDLYVLYLF